MDSVPARLLLIILLTVLVGFLNCILHAVENINEAKLLKRLERGERKAKRVVYLRESGSKFNHIVSILITVCELFCAAYIAIMWRAGFNGAPLRFLALIEVGYALCLFVFGQYIPKKIAQGRPDEISLALSWPIYALFKMARPVVYILTAFSNAFMSSLGLDIYAEENEITEEEIRMMVDLGSQSGAIDPDEMEMIHNIFELDDTPISEIMTHRTDLELIWLEDSPDVWEEVVLNGKHSVYPVCEETVDHIVGILYSQDFYKMLLKGEKDIKPILRPPVFVPETVKADEIFRKMQLSKNHFVVVLDEYGGMAGIITMSDLLEEIVGNLDVHEEPDIQKLDENTWLIKGAANLEEVAQELGVTLPFEEYNTLAGMILAQMGTIPDDGATPELEIFGLLIKITKIFEHRIEETKITVLEKDEKDADELHLAQEKKG